ncbi:nuclear transport factor 2 family protein [Pseudonocardia cypriaca]|uniref:SnoaL-like protein n=1 Tax=Pseudonocardia cypriaca TaxID=882449 RepID=A0A543GA68_9PSEU|nr:nuclear transport factor 2 family protein [Pseudonocardia cypriaca]TQM42951.1 SnoaL-like protein [Pseudonocardia cypriaca]
MGTTDDRRDVEDLVQRLAACLDDGRFDDMRSLFTADATASTPGGTAEGRDALVAQAARNHTPDKATQHLIAGVLVELAEHTATARANALVTFADRDGRPQLMMGEVYRFSARRTDEGWRLTSVQTVPTWRTQETTAPAA